MDSTDGNTKLKKTLELKDTQETETYEEKKSLQVLPKAAV